MKKAHRQSPVRRKRKHGVVWEARYTGPDGKRRAARPTWNGSRSTFKFKRDAQRAIDEALGSPLVGADTLDGFHRVWQQQKRSPRTAEVNKQRVGRTLRLTIEGRSFGSYPLSEVHRSHVESLVGALFEEQGRSPGGVQGVLRALSVLFEDAITLRLAETNPVKGVRVRANDHRAMKAARPTRIFSIEQMHAFAAACGDYEGAVRVLTDCGLRVGEMLALYRADYTGKLLHLQGTAWNGEVLVGDSREKRHVRTVPVPPSTARAIERTPRRIDTPFLFPTARGKVWRYSNFRRSVWKPAQEATGLDIRPHECRHSWITHMRKTGISDANLAAIAGHKLQTLIAIYAHADELDDDFRRIRAAIG